jgi:hypothetical protein
MIALGLLLGTRGSESTYTSTMTSSTAGYSIVRRSQGDRRLVWMLNNVGLNFSLGINATSMQPGQSLNLTLSLVNTLPSASNHTSNSASLMSLPQLSLGVCGMMGLPCGFAIAQGYYDADNISAATPLFVFNPAPALSSAGVSIAFYVFAPKSGSLTAYSYCNTGKLCHWERAITRHSFILNGSWEPYNSAAAASAAGMETATFARFSPGVYTVMAATEWGQVEILHFVVDSTSR